MATLEHRVEILEKKDRARAMKMRLDELKSAGYTGTRYNPTDAQTFASSSCGNCERKGLAYIGLVALQPWSYIAIAHCRRCSWWTEA